MTEAKAAKRRAKRHRKKEMEALRRCMDRKRRLEDYEDRVHYCDAPAGSVDKINIDIDVEIEGQTELKEEAVGIDEQIKGEIAISDGGGHANASYSISREPCTAEELSAEQRELLIEFDYDDGDSSEEEFMDTCPQDESERSSSFE